MLAKEGADVKIVGYTRNNFPKGSDNIPTEVLGSISHGNYFVRFINLLRTIPRLRKQAQEFDVIYCFSFDTLIIASISLVFQKHIIIYQVQDIKRQFFGDAILPRLYRAVERNLIKNITHLVISSVDYHTKYFAKYHNYPMKHTTVIENKLEVDPLQSIDLYDNLDKKISIGYFGVMRCKRSWEILKGAVHRGGGTFTLSLRGKPNAMPDLAEEIKEEENITFGGPYSSPDELQSIYENVNIVWAAYPYAYGKQGNWQMARTIRFYESCAFGRPVLVQKGTPQAETVLKFDIGKVIDMSDIDTAIDEVLSITPEIIKRWKENLLKVDRDIFVHTDEYKNLYKQLYEANIKHKIK